MVSVASSAALRIRRLAVCAGIGLTVLCGPAHAEPAAADGLRVLVTPSREAVISGEIDSRILFIGPGDGEAFAENDILVKLDCSLPTSSLTEARAELKAAEATLATKAKLDRLGSTSGLEVALARAAVDKANAAVQSAQWRVRQCVIHAPFDGRVVKRYGNAHEIATPGQKLIEIVSVNDPEARVIAPSAWAARVRSGDVFSITLDESGRTYDARVIAVGAKIDPASLSVEIRARILKADIGIAIGMSGLARFGAQN